MGEPLEEFVSKLISLSVVDETGAARLPPERELGVALGISRGALREQLSQLDSLGALRRRRGHGSYLDAPDVSFIRTYFALMRQLNRLSDDEFSSARAMLEAMVSGTAAILATESDVQVLRDLVYKMIAHTRAGDAEKALEADMEFHSYLYTIVDNPIFNMMNEGLSHVLRDNMRARRALAISIESPSTDGSMNTDAVHFEIVKAIEAHDADAANAAMRRHFDDFSLLALRARSEETQPGKRSPNNEKRPLATEEIE